MRVRLRADGRPCLSVEVRKLVDNLPECRDERPRDACQPGLEREQLKPIAEGPAKVIPFTWFIGFGYHSAHG
jgi:hypothetical protein